MEIRVSPFLQLRYGYVPLKDVFVRVRLGQTGSMR